MLKPTAYLHFSLPADMYAPEDAALVRRSFSYVAPTEVTPGDVAAIDLLVRLSGMPYLNAADLEAQATWEEIVCPWLSSKLKKIEDTLDACNDEDARSFSRHFSFDVLNLFLEDRVFSMRIEDGVFPAVIDIVEHVRELIAQGDERCTGATQFFCPSQEEVAPDAGAVAESSHEGAGAGENAADDNGARVLKHERGSHKVRRAYRTIGALAPSGDARTIAIA